MKKTDNIKTIQSVERALTILEQFSYSEKEIGLSDLAKKVGLKRTTCYGLAETLLYRGYLGFNEENSKYRLGIKTFELGQIYSNSLDLVKIARPNLQRLSSKYGFVVHLVVPDFYDAVYIDKVGESESFRVRSGIGTTAERFCTALSKVICSTLSEEELASVLPGALKQYTDNTIIDLDLYRKELAEVRANGYAIDMEELEQGLVCVAAPLLNYNQKTEGAISMSGPKQSMINNLDQIIEDVVDTAKQISAHIGR